MFDRKRIRYAVWGTAAMVIIAAVLLCTQWLQNKNRTKQVTDPEVCYANVWIIGSDHWTVTAFVNGEKKTYKTEYQLEKKVKNVIGDLYLQEGIVTRVTLKPDQINAKVLSYTDKYIELENFGMIEVDKGYKIYKIYDDVMTEMKSGILIEYNATNFVVSGGKICAAIIKEAVRPKDIRVLLNNPDTKEPYHQRIQVTSNTEYTVYYGKKKKVVKAGETLTFRTANPLLAAGRVRISANQIGGKITVSSMEKASGHPSYRGTLELRKYGKGLTLINELSIEEYLYSVIPSEMPVSFGLTALEVQAICARSYAYSHLSNVSLSAFGAHVDDSVSYQEYNQIGESKVSNRAVDETRSLVMEYEDQLIQANYFSTSCGYTASASDVWLQSVKIPYLISRSQTAGNKTKKLTISNKKDLREESQFRAFIEDKEATSYDSQSPWYRWKVTITAADLKKAIDGTLKSRYEANSQYVQTLQKDHSYLSVPIDTVGKIKRISFTQRGSGGIAKAIKIVGTKNTVIVKTEYNIRALLSPACSKIIRQDGSVIEGFSMLPSAFVYATPTYTNGKLQSITFTGGGFGHGVGMSQYGVKDMSELGKTYDEILAHYYPGIKIVTNSKIE